MGCDFGKGCNFAERCDFAERNTFAGWCNFAERCCFGEGCSFAAWTFFSAGCRFAVGCNFAEKCKFAKGCSILGHKMLDDFVRSLSGVGDYHRTLYVWNTLDGWYCQIGDRFDKEEEFIADLERTYGKDNHYKRAVKLLKEI